ncbi:MAG: hypothetical protein MRZ50_03635 [Prevotella sp.]|nr:hypothetical protein [Prevotella sp.]
MIPLSVVGGSKKDVNDITKLISKNERAMAQLEKQTHNVIDTVNNLDGATLAQLTQTEKALNAEMRKTPQNTQYFHELTEKLQLVKTQIASIREQTKQNYTEQKQLNDEIQNMNNVLAHTNTSSLKELAQAEATLKYRFKTEALHFYLESIEFLANHNKDYSVVKTFRFVHRP